MIRSEGILELEKELNTKCVHTIDTRSPFEPEHELCSVSATTTIVPSQKKVVI